MSPIPDDPLTPANKGQAAFTGVVSGLAGLVFLAFSVLAIIQTRASGRLGQPGVVLLICAMTVISAGFLDVAFAVFRSKEKRRAHLLSNSVLYLAGGFLIVVPLLLFAWSVAKGTEKDVSTALKTLSGPSIGLLAIGLARIRQKKRNKLI